MLGGFKIYIRQRDIDFIYTTYHMIYIIYKAYATVIIYELDITKTIFYKNPIYF